MSERKRAPSVSELIRKDSPDIPGTVPEQIQRLRIALAARLNTKNKMAELKDQLKKDDEEFIAAFQASGAEFYDLDGKRWRVVKGIKIKSEKIPDPTKTQIEQGHE